MAACSNCGHSISSAEKSWKENAVLQEKKMSVLGDPFSTGDEVLMRTFICPECGSSLDTEIAMKNDPFLEDRIFD
jgi:acetone carboxylase gamma subunit